MLHDASQCVLIIQKILESLLCPTSQRKDISANRINNFSSQYDAFYCFAFREYSRDTVATTLFNGECGSLSKSIGLLRGHGFLAVAVSGRRNAA